MSQYKMIVLNTTIVCVTAVLIVWALVYGYTWGWEAYNQKIEIVSSELSDEGLERYLLDGN